jgi:hypothetical protein
MLRAALTSWFQKFALHRLLVQRKTFRVNWSTTFMLASLAGAPDEGQFDTPLSQSAWIRRHNVSFPGKPFILTDISSKSTFLCLYFGFSQVAKK